ncbi:outer membrane beta-barrel family protein [Dyadobacter sp. CY327]|uniref:outer membrane beta-barrel family protein n=1 Tax=Dyadobacter sp. CY327 TaxID=2907301 RepID=UPI001F35BABC|nr:outer membrane beta-barrel family protein [Dyadobacter sp. CY327]MCE7069045.1 outer membrane beta-barrel family protein [Dyadobacter sp. CY327]
MKYIVIGNNNTLTQENEIEGQYAIDPDFSVSGIYKEHSYAAYAGYNNAFKSGWTVQSGLRYENTSQELTRSDVSRQYAGLFPSLGLNKSLKNGDMVNISYARKISRPSLTYLIPYRWLSDPYLVSVGNPNLRPSYEHTIDAGFSKGGLSLFINYTRTKDYISDVIYTDPETRSFVSIPENLKHVNSAYAGLSWNQELFKWWYTNCSVVLNASRTKTPIANIPGVNFSGFGMNSYTNNTFTLPKGYKIELLFIYNSPYRFAIMQNKQVYFMWLSFNKAVLKNGNVKISIQDVFRTQAYRYVTSYGPVYTSTRSYADNQRIRLSFNYNFGKKTVKQAKNRSLGNEAEKSRMGGGVM